MKKWLLSTLLALALAASSAAMPEPALPPILAPLQQQGQAASITAQILAKYHYTAAPLDRALSEKIFDRYLKELDPDKLFFIQADLDRAAAERSKICDAILHQDLHTPFNLFNAYRRHAVQRWTFSREYLKLDLGLSQQDDLRATRDKASWPESEEALRDLWRKQVRSDWLRMKQIGKNDTAAKDAIDKRYAAALANVYKLTGDYAFETFMNAFATSVDPHTGYLGAKASEDFEISMSLSLVGIGAVLKQTDDYVAVGELMRGSPAEQSGKLAIGDRVVGVAQGSDGAFVDVLGWSVDDVVSLIRGAKGTVVRLEVLPRKAGPHGNNKYVSLVRNQIALERQAAKKSIIRIADGEVGRKIGIISLPSFYQDSEARRKGDADFRSVTRDVEKFLGELKADHVDGILVDLRDNGGGSLDEAVRLAGLFIGNGPVVQQRDARGKVTTENGSSNTPNWTGPLAVLINRGSASASEIFAAAIQDYGRGVLIGEPSYGKGTVQTVLNLDRMAHNDKPKFGELKLTTTQFFRINGDTTQLHGVKPDIAFPSIASAGKFGESSFDNALPWTKIKAAQYARSGDLKGMLSALQSQHAQRVANDRNFQDFSKRGDVFDADAVKLSDIELKEAERRSRRASKEAAHDPRKKDIREEKGGKAKSPGSAVPPGDVAGLGEGVVEFKSRKPNGEASTEKMETSGQDSWLNEAVHILGNQIDLGRPEPSAP